MLANAYPSMFMLSGLTFAFFGQVIAIVIEIPVIAILWRRPLRRVVGTVVAANLLSAVAGAFPVWWNWVAAAPGVEADAWDIYQNYWQRHLQQVTVLFALTLVMEWGWHLAANFRAAAAMRLAPLFGSVFVGNVASYAVLVALVVRPPHGPADFEFADNTRWVSAPAERLWYFDTHENRLCSIRLDGSDRRVELHASLGRFTAVWDTLSVYVLESDGRLWAVDDDARWIEFQHDARLNTGRKFDVYEAGRLHEYAIWPLVKPVIDAHSTNSQSSPAGQRRVFFSRAPLEFNGFHDKAVHFDIDGYNIAPNWGTGLAVQDKRSNQKLQFAIRTSLGSLPCRDPIILDDRLIVFRCGGTICVMDVAQRRVGCLAQGDSMLMKLERFGPPDEGG